MHALKREHTIWPVSLKRIEQMVEALVLFNRVIQVLVAADHYAI